MAAEELFEGRSEITQFPMMEESLENWHLYMEMECGNDLIDRDKCHSTDDEEFLRGILEQTPAVAFSSETETESDQSFHASSSTVNSLNNSSRPRPRPLSSPRTYILSFDNSTMVPATSEPLPFLRSPNNSSLPTKRSLQIPAPEPSKKTRTSSQTIDHIMAERRRRQELTERFIALSATIPGLNRTDKASVLGAAIDYVKKLQAQVQELEKQDKKKSAESVIFIKKPDPNGNNEDTTLTETNCSILPEMEARVLGKEVLIEIHCEKENGVELKILDHLENLHLSVTGSSVLPFGNSALCITITAQMGDGYQMTVNGLVKNLRQVLSKSHLLSNSDPY